MCRVSHLAVPRARLTAKEIAALNPYDRREQEGAEHAHWVAASAFIRGHVEAAILRAEQDRLPGAVAPLHSLPAR